MSSKGTILLTKDNEHWYEELDGHLYEKTKTQRCIVLEISKQHRIEFDDDDDCYRVIIEENTELYNALIPKRRAPTLIGHLQK